MSMPKGKFRFTLQKLWILEQLKGWPRTIGELCDAAGADWQNMHRTLKTMIDAKMVEFDSFQGSNRACPKPALYRLTDTGRSMIDFGKRHITGGKQYIIMEPDLTRIYARKRIPS